jgi:hypothetical protein
MRRNQKLFVLIMNLIQICLFYNASFFSPGSLRELHTFNSGGQKLILLISERTWLFITGFVHHGKSDARVASIERLDANSLEGLRASPARHCAAAPVLHHFPIPVFSLSLVHQLIVCLLVQTHFLT